MLAYPSVYHQHDTLIRTFLLGIVWLVGLSWLLYVSFHAKNSPYRWGTRALSVSAISGLLLAGQVSHLILVYQPGLFTNPALWFMVGNIGGMFVFFIWQLTHYQPHKRERPAQQQAESAPLALYTEQLLRQQHAQLEARLADVTAELAVANRDKYRVFSIISHDLRSPVASLNDSLRLLQQHMVSQADFVNLTRQLSKSTDRLYNNLDNLLHWSLTQLDELRSQPRPVLLRDLADDVLDLAESTAMRKEITLNNLIIPTIPVWADEDQLRTVLRNLVDNALKFTPVGGEITLWGQRSSNWGTLHIRDTGVGIAPQRLKTLFTQAASEPGTHGEKGMGFGLRLCRDLIERNGGRLAVSSKAGNGTTFRLQLPLVQAPARTATPACHQRYYPAPPGTPV
ncbi:sensor histidine kinase [Fibrella arboris]|uniref:sensor histidine kinase n=1 Tax=Fibrella arboris TaxID=3242486 RepID=UPI0035206968